MEYIKKTIQLIMTTGTTVPCTYRNIRTGELFFGCRIPKTDVVFSGCTGSCYVIIPNTGVTYNIKFGLVQNSEDIGFFDAYMVDTPYNYIQLYNANPIIAAQNLQKFESILSGQITLAASGLVTGHSTGYITGTAITPISYNVTGQSSSRLTELKKYVIGVPFSQQYVSGGNFSTDGVNYPQSIGNKVVYFLGGIRYVDTLSGPTSGTTFLFFGQGFTNSNFINKPIYKDMNKENIISNPKIYDDVFIVRQEISAFDKNYRLEYISSLVDLTTYAGGKFFNIVNNT